MKRFRTGTLALALASGLAACGGGEGGGNALPRDTEKGGGSGGGAGTVALTGAGATFPYPIYSKWFDTYGRENPVRITYGSIGSGGGIRPVTEGTVDFGASAAPMNEEELAKAPGILHIPTVLGAVTVAYNLPGVQQPIRLSGELLADVFRGQITKWNDPRIAALNPGMSLPARDILVVYRTDGSGTTYVFTDYLSGVSQAWKQQVGIGKSVKWPTGLGAQGNEGVAGQVRQTEGAVGYVELAYARQTNLQTASVQNRAGQFVQPSVEATTAAAEGLAQQLGPNSDFRVSIVNPAGAAAYPIASWTYLLVPPQMQDCAKARALVDVVRWGMGAQGDAQASELHYAPLPADIERQVLARLQTVTCGPNRQPVAAAAS
ncbi:MAG TPA: phosphate ABC transporter substrate-binding protein PstS [Longimicrobiaceae bacterium]|nr:phosphate ABC transporter substrate-binding protein PstS [Longimicrobiaceae bacterium]